MLEELDEVGGLVKAHVGDPAYQGGIEFKVTEIQETLLLSADARQEVADALRLVPARL